MKKIVKKIQKKIIKIQTLKEKLENKQNDLKKLLCYFTKDFIENDYQNIKVNDILVVFTVDNDGIFIAWDIKVIDVHETYIECMESKRNLTTISKKDCTEGYESIFIYLTQEKYKKLATIIDISHWGRKF
jgi:hypothetical protein